MRDSISKKDVKLAIKEVLNEEKMTQKELRKLVQEEFKHTKENEENEERNLNSKKMAKIVWEHLFTQNRMFGWYFLQFILMLPIAVGMKLETIVADVTYEKMVIQKVGNFSALLTVLVLFILVLVVLVVICVWEAKVYDKIKLSNPKYANAVWIAMALYWFDVCWSDIKVIDFLTNFI